MLSEVWRIWKPGKNPLEWNRSGFYLVLPSFLEAKLERPDQYSLLPSFTEFIRCETRRFKFFCCWSGYRVFFFLLLLLLSGETENGVGTASASVSPSAANEIVGKASWNSRGT